MTQFLAGPAPVHGQISLWDATSYSRVAILKGSCFSCFCFSPDGSKLVAAHDDEIEMFDLTNVRIESGPKKRINLDRHKIDAESKEFIPDSVNTDEIISLNFSNLGKLLIRQTHALSLVDFVNKKVVWSIPAGRCWVKLAFTADDEYIIGSSLSISDISRLFLIDAASGKFMHESIVDSAGTWNVGVSNDCRTVATGGIAKTVFLWTLVPNKHGGGAVLVQHGQLRGHNSNVTSLVFLDVETLVTGSEDWTARIWNVNSCEQVHYIQLSDGYPTRISYCPHLNRIAFLLADEGDPIGIDIVDAQTYADVATITINGMNDAVWDVAYSPASTVIFM